jgi:hypothetical protein
MRNKYTRNEFIVNGDTSEMIVYSVKCEPVGKVIIDTEDIELLRPYKWYKNTAQYIQARVKDVGQVYLHRFIMGNDNPLKIDHINRNRFDNRKANLRFCTDIQNSMNKRGNLNGSSIYKGVCWHKDTRKWLANIMIHNKTQHIGLYELEKDAARAYDKKAKELYGQFAYLNFKEE